jgi:hypothetical protein
MWRTAVPSFRLQSTKLNPPEHLLALRFRDVASVGTHQAHTGAQLTLIQAR